MSTRKYRGRVTTIEEAMMADMVVTIECQNCPHWSGIHAYRLCSMKPELRSVRFGRPISGFKCKGCRTSVEVVIRAGMR